MNYACDYAVLQVLFIYYSSRQLRVDRQLTVNNSCVAQRVHAQAKLGTVLLTAIGSLLLVGNKLRSLYDYV